MAQILVREAFNLTLDGGERQSFTVGSHEVAEDVALHWYTAAYADVVDEALKKKAAKLREKEAKVNSSTDPFMGRVFESLPEHPVEAIPAPIQEQYVGG